MSVFQTSPSSFELRIVYCAHHLCKMRGESENYSSQFMSFQKAFKRCEVTYENIKIRNSEFSLKIDLVVVEKLDWFKINSNCSEKCAPV